MGIILPKAASPKNTSQVAKSCTDYLAHNDITLALKNAKG
jgi:hypothetical protein